jgi:ParB family chromosome partitioning protein
MSTRTHTATTLKIAVAAQSLFFVPLSQLRQSTRNVRKPVGASITELAANIARPRRTREQ